MLSSCSTPEPSGFAAAMLTSFYCLGDWPFKNRFWENYYVKHGGDRSTCMKDLSLLCCPSDNIKASERRVSAATKSFTRHLMKFEVLNVFLSLMHRKWPYQFHKCAWLSPVAEATTLESFLSVTTSRTLTKNIHSDTILGWEERHHAQI